MNTLRQGFSFAAVPAIASYAAYQISRRWQVAAAAAGATMAVAYGINRASNEQLKFGAKVVACALLALAAGGIVYLESEKVTLSTLAGGAAGIGPFFVWGEAVPAGKSPEKKIVEQPEAAPLEPNSSEEEAEASFADLIDELRSESEQGITEKNSLIVLQHYFNLKDWILSVEEGDQKRKAQELVQEVGAFVESYVQDHNKLSQIQADNEADNRMRAELEKTFELIEVADDGSCAVHAALAVLESEMRVSELRQGIAEYVRENRESDEIATLVVIALLVAQDNARNHENGVISDTLRKEIQTEGWSPFTANGAVDIDLYCKAICDTRHWFTNSELQLMAKVLEVNIGVYAGALKIEDGKLVLNDNYSFRCGDDEAKWIYLWNAQAEGHYYGLKEKSED